MNKILLYLIILAIFMNTASAAQLSGSITSLGKKIPDQKIDLFRVNATQSAETGTVYSFIPLTSAATDKDGNFTFNDLKNGMYRINMTYNGITYGENIGVQENAVVNFNLSEKIEGYVLKANSTLEGIPVRLTDVIGIEQMSTSTDKAGKYSFGMVNAGQSFMLQLNYSDVPYVKPANASEKVNITVYDSTKNGDVLSVKIDHIVLSKTSGGIKVDEYVEFINTGDKAFFSKERSYVGISTPEGISRFQTDAMECCLQREKDSAWIDPMNPILPGESYGVSISYVFDPESSKNILSKNMIYNTSYMTLLSDRNNGFGIESQAGNKEVVSNEGKQFEVLSFMNVPRDQKLDISITGYIPSSTDIGGSPNYLIPIAAIILIGAVSYPLLKDRIAKKQKRRVVRTVTAADASVHELKDTSASDEIMEASIRSDIISDSIAGKDITEMSFEELFAAKKEAFESILSLENKFKAGEITEKEYKKLKKDQKENATLILKQLKEAAINLDLALPVADLEKRISHIGDIDILEELLDREKEGENRTELKEIIEQRIDDIERSE